MGETPSWEDFIGAWELFRNPTLAGTLAGGLLGYLGVFVVLRRMVFLSAALSQCAGLGVTLAFYAQLHMGVAASVASPLLGAAALTMLGVLLPLSDRSELGSRRDGLLGLLFLGGSAGTVIVGTKIVQELQDVETLLFGSAVVVLDEQMIWIASISLLLWTLHLWWMRGFIQVSLDRQGARVRGLPVRALDIALLLSLALAISVFTRVLGALPVFAFSVLPAMAAVRLAPSVPLSLIMATVMGALSGFLGYLVAFFYELPVGPSQAGVAASFVLAAELTRVVFLRARLLLEESRGDETLA